MKLLWIINRNIPQISEHCNPDKISDAGWISSALDDIRNNANPEIVVCFYDPMPITHGHINGITYYSFNENSFTKLYTSLEVFFINVIEKENPDIIHIFGTEYPHSLSAVRACEKTHMLDKCVINIQGLISHCAEKYYAGLPVSAIHGFTPRDFLKMDNVYFQRRAFRKRGKYETKAIKTAKNIIGRTDWDCACVKKINPSINYFPCNESLRDCFYDKQWNYDTCEKHSIFISQGYYPLKGMHHALKAFSEILKKYPDAHLYTTDANEESRPLFYRLKHTTFYQLYIKRIIKRYNLKGKITFLGELNGPGMQDRYLKSNVFLLCSSLENSSNSLGEAMALGVPCISSYVGGITSLISHNTEGFLYPFDEPYMISYYIDKIFSDYKLANSLSKNARAHALITHSRDTNRNRLKEIYDLILENKGEI
ncbi:MAG: glycosyltransferase [Clostridia bacterium]|nr:glycosyltransferase [Clostridia bacterium]